MSDNWLQVSALGSGVTAATATLTGVTAGSTLAAFCFNGSTSAPTTHSVSDGTAYSPGASAIDTGNAIYAQVFYLQNAGAGTHAAIFSGDIGNGLDIYLVEIGTTAGASAVVDTKANDQVGVAGGAGANALTSGSLAMSAPCTVAAMCCDTTSANPGDEPSVGTTPFTFTTRANAVTSNSGAGRVETAAASASGAATFGVTSGSPGNYVTLAIAVLNASGSAPLDLLGKRIWVNP